MRKSTATPVPAPRDAAQLVPRGRSGRFIPQRINYLWLGTAEGLVRFDGNQFTVYDRTSTPALPSGNIKSLAVAADGALWIGFRRHGLARLHANQLTRWTTTEGLSGNEIVSLVTTPDGSIWAGAATQGLNRIRQGRVTIYRRQQDLPDNDCYALAVAAAGGVLVGTATGVANVSDAGVKPVPLMKGETPAPVSAILESDSGGLWVGTPRGLWHLEAGHQRRYTVADGLPSDDVTALVHGGNRTLWIGMRSGGLARLRDARFESFTIADGLPNDFVHALYEDRERNLWVGTNAGGLSRLRDTPFRTVSTREGLPSEVVRAVFESRDGGMWVGTHGHGLIRLLNGTVTRWTTRDGLPGDGISMIGESRDGAMWIGTAVGLIRMNGRSLTRYTTASGLPHENVRSLFEDRDGRIWIGTAGGICRIENERCRAVEGLGIYARGFHQSPDGAIWIAGHGGLFRYHAGRVKHWGTEEGLSSTFLTSMAAESDGTLWLSTADAGLNRFNGGHITRYGLGQGLYDETIYRVLSDGRGGVWMTSNRGLFRVARAELDALAERRGATLRSHAYTEVDGLHSPEFVGGSFPSGVVTRNGRLWLPSVKGVVVFDSARMDAAAPPPQTHLERMAIDGKPFNPAAPATLGPGVGRLEFSYTAFQFAAPTRLRFRYKLEGFDANWVDAGARRAAYYTSLPPGHYVFRVQASNGPGAWGPAAATAAIALAPRFHQTGWFIACSVVAAGLLVFGGVNARTARLRAQEQRLLAMVDARTRELQEEVAERTRAERALVEAREAALEASRLKSEFLANMSHEIRTPMNGVIGMTGLALDHRLDPQVREYLHIVQSSADGLLHVINDILDFAKIEAGRLELLAVDFEVRDLLNSLVALLGPEAAKKGLALRSEVSSDVPQCLTGDPLRLRQVLTHLVGNASKFTDRGEIRIEVTRAAPCDGSRPVGLRFAVLVKLLLEKAGHTVTVVETGVQAIEAVAGSDFDVVLMDIQMPEMDGLDATMRIRAGEKNGRRLPVIALTAHAMEADRERCLAAGMDGYISKPISPDALFTLLADHTGDGTVRKNVISAPRPGA